MKRINIKKTQPHWAHREYADHEYPAGPVDEVEVLDDPDEGPVYTTQVIWCPECQIYIELPDQEELLDL